MTRNKSLNYNSFDKVEVFFILRNLEPRRNIFKLEVCCVFVNSIQASIDQEEKTSNRNKARVKFFTWDKVDIEKRLYSNLWIGS